VKNKPNISSYGTSNYPTYDLIGDIAIIRIFSSSLLILSNIKKAAQSILNDNKNIKTVLLQSSSIKGNYRLRKLDYILGEKKTLTIHKENNCLFSVDLEKCYFSPRLQYERNRILNQIQPNEIIINMFAGVGCFSILIAKRIKSTKIYSIDINPIAIDFMKKNIQLNRVFNRVIPIFGDAKKIVEKQFIGVCDRVLMPLPEKAFEYLPSAIQCLKPSGGWVHYYDFEYSKKDENPLVKTMKKVGQKLTELNIKYEIITSKIVRSVGPNWYQIVLDIRLFKIQNRF
jgi:tRNA (guanine37-N1)-methyltransferase